MMEVLRQTTLSEVMLFFNLLFIVPMLILLIMRLRKYEALYGPLQPGGKRKKAAPEPQPQAMAPAAMGGQGTKPVPDNVFPYRTGTFLSSGEKACLSAMREALGGEVEVFPKVALWEFVESTDDNPGYLERLHGKDFDFLVCDRRTGQPLTAVMFEPGKGRPAGPADEMKKICAAAGANLIFLEAREDYDAGQLKKALGIPELDI